MKNALKPRSLTRSIMAFFGTKKQLATYKRLPDAYYKHIWFGKRMFEGIELVSKIERILKKQAAHGVKRFMRQ